MKSIYNPNAGACLLSGEPIVQDIEQWCQCNGHIDDVEPALAVIFFNTDAAAEHYIQIKAHIAAEVFYKTTTLNLTTGTISPLTNLTIFIGWCELLSL